MKEGDSMAISSRAFPSIYNEEEHPAGETVGGGVGVQHPGPSQHNPWDLHPSEEPPGSTALPKPLPANASGVSMLSRACRGWTKKLQRKARLEMLKKKKKNLHYGFKAP